MMAILNSLNAHNFPIFHPILMLLVSKFMVHRARSDKTYFLRDRPVCPTYCLPQLIYVQVIT